MEVMIAILIITSIILSIFFVYNAVESDDLPRDFNREMNRLIWRIYKYVKVR